MNIIAHNLLAMNSQRQLGINTRKNIKSTEKLSSGYKINRAADDAAGLSISEKMRKQIRGLNQGADNIQEGVGYCQVADGALAEIQDMLHRMTELSIQSANGTNSQQDREYIQDEIAQIKEELNRICETTKYNEDYIFKAKDKLEPYDLGFKGLLNDMYIYNETFSDASGNTTVTYGGIAYDGKRYSWDGINPDMYDSATNTFNEGIYTFIADDGAYVTLECKDGTEPPTLTRKFRTDAGERGIYINNELIEWKNVRREDGISILDDTIINEPYSFKYHGVTISFTPDEGEPLEDVIERIKKITLESVYDAPTEETALFADFSETWNSFKNDAHVENYLKTGNVLEEQFSLCADDTGLSIKDSDGNTLSDSAKTWEEIGITNWGNGSYDIWSDKIYDYVYDYTGSERFQFSFNVINEISKDSVIMALDGVELTSTNNIFMGNHAEVAINNSGNILSAKLVRNTINLTLEEEFELGRDYSADPDIFGNEQIKYDANTGSFSVHYTGSRDVDNTGITNKTYANTEYETDNLVNDIKDQIKSDMDEYLSIVKQRVIFGAKDPTDINLTSLIGSSAITGGGADTYLEDMITFDADDPLLRNTLDFTDEVNFSGASIDFSGLGNSYQLADLIGMGFNSTCQTCTNHYSIQFATESGASLDWKEAVIDGNTYKYSYQKQGNDYTLYIDLESMMNNNINDGIEFTNKLVDITEQAGYDFHYTQYATYTNQAKLYVFDNRPIWEDEAGNSTATDASFSPYAYGMNSIANIRLNLYDTTDSNEAVSIEYQYDYKDLFALSNMNFDVQQNDSSGLYVLNSNTNTYELYDPSNTAHQNVARYDVLNVSLNTNGADLDTFIDDYTRNTVFTEISNASKMSLVGDYAGYMLSAVENDNKAMVTDASLMKQIKPKKGSDIELLNIQCSSDVKDNIKIAKQKLSLRRMGIKNLDVTTQQGALRGITSIGKALEKVSAIRSNFGSYQNRLEHTYASNRNVEENTQAAESIIRDTDMANEMMHYTNNQILIQAGQSLLAQANQMQQRILSLLT